MRIEIAIDINNAQRMIPFYQELLGYQSNPSDDQRYGSDQIYYSLEDPKNQGPKLIFQVVPEPVTTKNRIHLDFHVSDVDAVVKRALDLGATPVDSQPIREAGTHWIRLTDPEGNYFCIVHG